MDAETRGLISQAIDNVFEKQNFLDTIDWILESDTQVKSKEDLAFGYFLGALSGIAHNYVRASKLESIALKSAERHQQKEVGKEIAKEAMERVKERLEDTAEEIRSRGGRPIEIEVTGKETEEIRKMLIIMFSSFRDKIRKEEALKKVRR